MCAGLKTYKLLFDEEEYSGFCPGDEAFSAPLRFNRIFVRVVYPIKSCLNPLISPTCSA